MHVRQFHKRNLINIWKLPSQLFDISCYICKRSYSYILLCLVVFCFTFFSTDQRFINSSESFRIPLYWLVTLTSLYSMILLLPFSPSAFSLPPDENIKLISMLPLHWKALLATCNVSLSHYIAIHHALFCRRSFKPCQWTQTLLGWVVNFFHCSLMGPSAKCREGIK